MSSPLTIPALLDEGVRRFGLRPAIVDGDVQINYTQLADRVRSVARAYLAANLRPGDRVAIWAPNRTEFILAMLGAQVIGAAVVPLNTRYRGSEARVIIERSRASAIVLCNGFLGVDYTGMLEDSAPSGAEPAALIAGLPHLHTLIDIGSGDRRTGIGWPDFIAGADQVSADDVSALEAEVTPETICDILFTSGTTGVPKGVMSAHRQTLAVADVWACGAALSPTDRYAVVNPFFHGFGYKAGVIAALIAGTSIYPAATFDPVELMGLVQRERITVLPGAPTIFTTLINHPRLPEFDLSSLRFAVAGAASVPENLFEQMISVLGFETVAQAYGLTECVVATQSRPHEDPRHVAETTGPACPGLEIRVVDAERRDLPIGSDGEILLRGETVMLGYFEDQKATDEAIDSDGWFATGDIGRLDEHGCLKITDRIKDMFTVGGFNVYPAEIENSLSDHPDVVESAVVGIPDERMGSFGRAYIVVRNGADVDDTALRAYCREHLANFKVPREFVFVEELPRNASGKILKNSLR